MEKKAEAVAYLLCHANNEPLLFDLVGLDGLVILQDFACVLQSAVCATIATGAYSPE